MGEGERKELVEKLEALEKKLEEKEKGEKRREEKRKALEIRMSRVEGGERGVRIERSEWVARIKRMEWVMEKGERERRRRNLIFKGVRGESVKEEVLKICRES